MDVDATQVTIDGATSVKAEGAGLILKGTGAGANAVDNEATTGCMAIHAVNNSY